MRVSTLSLIAIHKDSGFRVEQPNGISAAIEVELTGLRSADFDLIADARQQKRNESGGQEKEPGVKQS